MKYIIAIALLFAGTVATAEDDFVPRAFLTAATEALNECRATAISADSAVCIRVYIDGYSSGRLLTTAKVPYQKKDGESDVDAATRTCAAMTDSLQPRENTGVSMYCFPCAVIQPEEQKLTMEERGE